MASRFLSSDPIVRAIRKFDAVAIQRYGVDSILMDMIERWVPLWLVNYFIVVLIKFLAFIITCLPFLRHRSASPEMTAVIWIFAGVGSVMNITVTRSRNSLSALNWMYPPLEEVEMKIIPGNGRPKGYFLRTTPNPHAGIILWFYGGAFIGGDAPSNVGLLGRLGVVTKCNVFLSAHRRVPENSIEDILQDALEAYEWLCASTNPVRIILGGISSGSLLATLLLTELPKRSLPMPAGAFLLSAWLDLTGGTPSMQDSPDPFISNEVIQFVSSLLGRMVPDGRPEYWSPFTRPVEGFPPLFMAYSDTESCADENALYAARARREGVAVEEVIIKDTFHAFALFHSVCPESLWVYCKLIAFIERRLQQSSPTKAVTR